MTIEQQPSRLDADDRGSAQNAMPRAARTARKRARKADGKVGRMSASVGNQHERQTRGIESGLRNFLAQPSLDREQKLNAAGAGAHQRQSRAPVTREHAIHAAPRNA